MPWFAASHNFIFVLETAYSNEAFFSSMRVCTDKSEENKHRLLNIMITSLLSIVCSQVVSLRMDDPKNLPIRGFCHVNGVITPVPLGRRYAFNLLRTFLFSYISFPLLRSSSFYILYRKQRRTRIFSNPLRTSSFSSPCSIPLKRSSLISSISSL